MKSKYASACALNDCQTKFKECAAHKLYEVKEDKLLTKF